MINEQEFKNVVDLYRQNAELTKKIETIKEQMADEHEVACFIIPKWSFDEINDFFHFKSW
ncbi:MAG: hypothetical protein GY765_09370 [bacterium]|nr:hypothetical protein [bacterium]